MKASEKAYKELEYLAVKYANKLYSYEELSLERDDLLQEFRLKIFTSIKAYGRRWLAYRRGEAPKPVPLKYYVECACSNKGNDIMRAIRKENYKLRIDQTAYDYGVEDTVHVDSGKDKFVLNDVDVLANLTGVKRVIFSMHVRGQSKKLMARVLRTPFAVAEGYDPNMMINDAKMLVDKIIEDQKQYLLNNHRAALYYTPTRYDYYRVQED